MTNEEISVGANVVFRTTSMRSDGAERSGVVVAALDTLKGKWFEIETSEGKFRTRAALMKPAAVAAAVAKPKAKAKAATKTTSR